MDNGVTNNATEEESAYFEDYDSPRFKWTYVDMTGNQIFDPIYDNVRDFNNGKAVVNYKGKWGLIDKNNKTLIPFIYKELNVSTKGIALAKSFNNKYHILSMSNDTLQNLSHKEIYPFSQGLARFKSDYGWGFMDTKGDTIISPDYQSVMDFKNDMAVVNRHDKKGVIDKQGKIIIPVKYDQLSIYNEYIRVGNGNKWGLINKNRKEILPLNYDFISNPKDDLVLLKSGVDKFIYNLKSGEKIDVKTDIVDYAGEGLWLVEVNGKMGLCDITGKIVTQRLYDLIYQFQEGKAVYNLGQDRWGYLNADGSPLTPPIYPLNWSFENGYGRVILEGGIGFINQSGEVVIPGRFLEVKNFHEGLARVQVYRR